MSTPIVANIRQEWDWVKIGIQEIFIVITRMRL